MSCTHTGRVQIKKCSCYSSSCRHDARPRFGYVLLKDSGKRIQARAGLAVAGNSQFDSMSWEASKGDDVFSMSCAV